MYSAKHLCMEYIGMINTCSARCHRLTSQHLRGWQHCTSRSPALTLLNYVRTTHAIPKCTTTRNINRWCVYYEHVESLVWCYHLCGPAAIVSLSLFGSVHEQAALQMSGDNIRVQKDMYGDVELITSFLRAVSME